MNNRRKLIVAIGATALGTPLASFPQKKVAKVYRIGVLNPGTSSATAHLHEAFKQGLREHGYVEGQNVIVERRHADGKVERLSELAAELVRVKADVIVVATDAGVLAAKQETQTIPIVMAGSTDPVGTGFVASLARPGGNVTGLNSMSPALSGKRLELLNEIVSDLSRVAIIWNPEIRGTLFDYNETVSAARSLRLQLHSVELRRTEDLDRTLRRQLTVDLNLLMIGLRAATTGHRRCFLKPAGQTSAGRAGSSGPVAVVALRKSIRLYRPRAPPTKINICLQQPI